MKLPVGPALFTAFFFGVATQVRPRWALAGIPPAPSARVRAAFPVLEVAEGSGFSSEALSPLPFFQKQPGPLTGATSTSGRSAVPAGGEELPLDVVPVEASGYASCAMAEDKPTLFTAVAGTIPITFHCGVGSTGVLLPANPEAWAYTGHSCDQLVNVRELLPGLETDTIFSPEYQPFFDFDSLARLMPATEVADRVPGGGSELQPDRMERSFVQINLRESVFPSNGPRYMCFKCKRNPSAAPCTIRVEIPRGTGPASKVAVVTNGDQG